MVKPGDVITNRLSGGRIEFLDTAASTGGMLLRFRHLVRRGGAFNERHFHPNQEETIFVETGTLRMEIDGAQQVLGPGETVTVPRGARHQHINDANSELQMRVEFRPALRMESWLEQLYGCCNFTGKRAGQFGVLQKTVWINAYDMFAADHSLVFQRTFSAIVGPTICRLFGYRPYNPDFAAAAHAPAGQPAPQVHDYATAERA